MRIPVGVKFLDLPGLELPFLAFSNRQEIFMIKLHSGDQIAVVSLSNGILGEDYCSHQLKLGMDRLASFGLKPVIMPNALKGVNYLKDHPEARAQDLLQAFADEKINGIICAIGGDETYRLSPYILGSASSRKIIRDNPKFFMGYSDSTVNHLMLYQLGISSFYGLSFITDFAELDQEMLPYSKRAFENIFTNLPFTYKPSPIWYEERSDFSSSQTGSARLSHDDPKGFELLSGKPTFSGKLLGGCVESLLDLLTGDRYPEETLFNDQYGLFPPTESFQDAVLFLETSEEKITPDNLANSLNKLAERGIFDVISGILVGKPQNEVFYEEYKEIYRQCIPNPNLSIVYNVNFGHAYPKIIMQYGAHATMDQANQQLTIERL